MGLRRSADLAVLASPDCVIPTRPTISVVRVLSLHHYWLFELAELEGWRIGELLLCQIGRKFCLASNLKLTNRHGDELVANTEEAPDREDHCRYARMVEIDQDVFDLTDGRVTLIDLAADQLARPGAPRQRRIVNTRYRRRRLGLRRTVALRLLSMSRADSEKHHEYGRRRSFHLVPPIPGSSHGKCNTHSNRDSIIASYLLRRPMAEKEEDLNDDQRRRRQGRKRAALPAPPHVDDAEPVCLGSDGIIDAIQQPLIVLDEKLRVVSANRAFYRIFAVTRGETVGRQLVAIGDGRLDVSALRDFLDLTQAGGAVVEDYEIEIELPALGRRVLRLNGRQIRRDPCAAREILVTIDDVTERQLAETMLRSARWHAERANLGKSRFLAAASHDLRQPLQTLSLLRRVLAKNIKDKKIEDALKLVTTLNETAGALQGMLDMLLDINQLEAGIVQPEKINFPINDLLEQLRIDFAYHARVHGLGWRVVPCRSSVWSDPSLLVQMIRNLLSNAVKYTERGKILLG